MIVITFETLVQSYRSDEWEEYEADRNRMTPHFPFSVAIEGSLDEGDSLEEWMIETFGLGLIASPMWHWNMETSFPRTHATRVGPEQIEHAFGPGNRPAWSSLWYSKTDYDYGCWEYFFSNEQDMQTFIQKIPDLWVELAPGKWYRTEGNAYKSLYKNSDEETDSLGSERRNDDSSV
jgi:hypothetical protein